MGKRRDQRPRRHKTPAISRQRSGSRRNRLNEPPGRRARRRRRAACKRPRRHPFPRSRPLLVRQHHALIPDRIESRRRNQEQIQKRDRRSHLHRARRRLVEAIFEEIAAIGSGAVRMVRASLVAGILAGDEIRARQDLDPTMHRRRPPEGQKREGNDSPERRHRRQKNATSALVNRRRTGRVRRRRFGRSQIVFWDVFRCGPRYLAA